MGVTFTPDEGSVLYRLLAENSTDIILKTDCAGNLLHGLPTMSRLGLLPPAQSGARHLRDLVDPVCEETVLGAHREALDGQGEDAWKRELNSLIRRHQAEIDAILREAGVPLLNDMGTELKPES